MMRKSRVLYTATCFVTWAVCVLAFHQPVFAASPSWAEQPDIILHNAKIVTVDKDFSIATAVSIRDGRFEYVGNNQEVLERAGANTEIIDLKGRTVLPGMADTHNDIAKDAETWALLVDLSEARSIVEIQELLTEAASETRDGEWIWGSRGWWEYEMAEGRIPTRAELDDALPNNPGCIPGPHYQLCNSMALEIAGVNRKTQSPPGGQIWKDENGAPTGLLMDSATDFVRPYYPKATRNQKKQGLKDLYDRVTSWGITSYREPGGTREMAELVHELWQEGDLNLRVDWAYSVPTQTPPDEWDEVFEELGPPGQRFGDGMFRADGIAEIGIDGAEKTAYLRDEYPGQPGYRGIRKLDQEQYDALIMSAAKHGWRPGPHVVGDAGIDLILGSYHKANQAYGIADRRWMLDHAFLILPDHYSDIKELGLIINSQSMHNYQLGEAILEAWGRPLADMSERYRDWVENGIIFGNGSDGPVSYVENPMYFIYYTVTRNTAWGGRLGPDQGLSRADAIRSVTIWAAHTSFEENLKGSIEPGKYADFVVLSDDVLTVPVNEITDIEVLATVLGGRTVYGSLVLADE